MQERHSPMFHITKWKSMTIRDQGTQWCIDLIPISVPEITSRHWGDTSILTDQRLVYIVIKKLNNNRAKEVVTICIENVISTRNWWILGFN